MDADDASETFERDKDLSTLEQLEGELAELQAALELVDAGTAGTAGVDEQTGPSTDPLTGQGAGATATIAATTL